MARSRRPLAMPAAKVLYGQLYVESAVRDDRGKYVAGHATARYAGRDRYVGLRQEDWLWTTGTPAQLRVLVVNEHGVAVAGTAVRVTTGAAPDQGRAGERGRECLPAALCLELDRGVDMCARL